VETGCRCRRQMEMAQEGVQRRTLVIVMSTFQVMLPVNYKRIVSTLKIRVLSGVRLCRVVNS